MMRRGLYLVTPDWADTAQLLAVSAAAIRGGAVCLQYRNKTASAALRLTQAQALARLTHETGVTFIVNDDLQLARSVCAEGVHLGRDDGELTQLDAPALLVGVSCYNEFARAAAAHAAGAAYVAFGAMYPSPTKPQAVPASVALVRQAKQALAAHVVCIGGITAENAPALVAAGADNVAVISDVFAAADPEARAEQYADLF